MKKIILFVSHILFTTTILFAQTPTNKIVLNKGQKFLAATTANGTASLEMMGQNMETVSESSQLTTIEVKDVKPSGYVLTSTMNKMKLKSKGGMSPTIDFDSDKKEDMNGEIGKNVKEEFSPKDAEISMTGKSIIKDTGDIEDMSKVMRSVMSGISDNSIGGNFILIPAGKKAGDIWTDSSNTNGIKIHNTYTLKQINSNDAIISINSVSTVNKTVEAQGQELIVTMDSKVSSTDIVDITTGLIKEKRTIVEGKGNLNAGGQEMPLTTKMTMVTTVKNM